MGSALHCFLLLNGGGNFLNGGNRLKDGNDKLAQGSAINVIGIFVKTIKTQIKRIRSVYMVYYTIKYTWVVSINFQLQTSSRPKISLSFILSMVTRPRSGRRIGSDQPNMVTTKQKGSRPNPLVARATKRSGRDQENWSEQLNECVKQRCVIDNEILYIGTRCRD